MSDHASTLSRQCHLVQDEEAMQRLGAALARVCQTPCVIYLQGELGAGKTTLVRGFLRELGYQGSVKSPTYTLVEPYSINQQNVYHFDLYRLTEVEELEDMGVRDYFNQDSICLIEWPEYGQPLLSKPDITCHLVGHSNYHQVTLAANTNMGKTILSALRFEG